MKRFNLSLSLILIIGAFGCSYIFPPAVIWWSESNYMKRVLWFGFGYKYDQYPIEKIDTFERWTHPEKKVEDALALTMGWVQYRLETEAMIAGDLDLHVEAMNRDLKEIKSGHPLKYRIYTAMWRWVFMYTLFFCGLTIWAHTIFKNKSKA